MHRGLIPLEHWGLVQTTTEASGGIPDSQMFQTRLKWQGWELKHAHTLARQGELSHSGFGWMLGVKKHDSGEELTFKVLSFF